MFDSKRITEQTFVRSVVARAELESTNDLAIELARHGAPITPLLVLTDRQTAGRGRGQNRWWSGDGSLTLSLLLRECVRALPVGEVPQIALCSAWAVCEAIRDVCPGLEVGLKWPNDVYLGSHRKLCGILVELPAVPQRAAVIGIGINVNNTFGNAPPDVAKRAISLRDATSRQVDMNALLIRVLQRLELSLDLLLNAPEQLRDCWRQRCILTGRTIRLLTEQRKTEGICRGIDEHGHLVVETDTGPIAFASGVVKFGQDL